MLLYPSAIDLSTTHLRHVADLLRAHRRAIGSRWRKLSAGRQALLVLAHLRNGDTYTRLAAGFDVGIATVFRYLREATDLLAAQAPSLTAALWQLAWTHHNYAIVDGTVIRIDRLAADRPFYSGKHRYHGINLQALTDPTGRLLWISEGLPGSVNDTNAARTHHIPETCAAAGILLLADTGYTSVADGVLTPYRNLRNQHTPRQPLPPAYKAANQAHSAARAPGERGFATLKAWRVFTRVRCCPHRITTLAKAVLTLEHGPNQ